MNVAVVGAGIMGASTALALTDRGHAVTVFEQHPAGHGLGSSHGRSRIVRKAYVDPRFAKVMLEAYPMWAALEARLGMPILHETGLLFFSDAANPDFGSLVGALEANGVSHELDCAERVLPQLRLGPRDRACFSGDGGWVRADACVLGTLRLALEQGASLVRARAELRDLTRTFDRVAVCAGAWSRSFAPVVPTLQTVAYLEMGRPVTGPVWIYGEGHNVYGFPSEPAASSVKFGVHSAGVPIDADDPTRPIQEGHLEILRSFARDRLGVPDPVLTDAASCVYTRAKDERFLWGQLENRAFWVSACSGHGFKFGPWIGARMADWVEGSSAPDSAGSFG